MRKDGVDIGVPNEELQKAFAFLIQDVTGMNAIRLDTIH
jgi:hypothetical protein